jgi:hypothetical protein
MMPYEIVGTERQKQIAAAFESEADVKKAVRLRDKYACRDCGMTAEQHKKKFGAALEVHRLVPGLQYAVSSCVTLCEDCHNKKPRHTKDAFFCKDLRWIGFNLYDERDSLLYRALMAEAEGTGRDFQEVLLSLLEEKIAVVLAHDRDDAMLTNDGLW